MTEQINIGIGHRTSEFFCLNIETSDIDGLTRIGRTLLRIWWTSATSYWDRSWSLGHPSKFQRVSHLSFITAAMSLTRGQLNFAPMFGRLLCWYRINIFSVPLVRNGILPCAIFALCTNLALSYIGSITVWHSSSGHQPNFVALNKRATPIFGRAANTLGIGPHSSCECICGLLMFGNSTTWSWGNYPILGRASQKGGGAEAPNVWPMSIVAKRVDGSRCHLAWR